MKKRWLSLWAFVAVATVPSCAVLTVTSKAMYESTEFHADDKKIDTPCCYRVGECVYLPVKVTYARYEHVPLALVIKDRFDGYSLHIDAQAYTENVYYLLSPQDARELLGITVPDPPKGTAPYIEEEDWEAAAAERVPILRRKLKIARTYHKTYTPNGHADRINKTKDGELEFDACCLESRISAHAIYKWPLVAVLAVGVDAPVLVLNCAATTVILPFYAAYEFIFDRDNLAKGPFH